MYRIFRPALFSTLTIGLLSGLSIYLYQTPRQIEHRVTSALQQVFSVDVQLLNCQAISLSAWSLKGLQVPAAPFLEERRFAELENVRVASWVPDRSDLPAWLLRPSFRQMPLPLSPPENLRGWIDAVTAQPWLHLTAEKSRLKLEGARADAFPAGWFPAGWKTDPARSGRAQSGGRGDEKAAVWNFHALLNRAALEPAAARKPFLLELENFEAQVRWHTDRRSSQSWYLIGREGSLAGWLPGSGLWGHGRLIPGPWKEGQFQFLFSPLEGLAAGEVEVRRLENLESWLPFLPEGLQLLERELRPRGLMDVEVYYRRKDQAPSIHAAKVHLAASTLQIRREPWPLSQVSGDLFCEGDRVLLGRPEERAALSGTLYGSPVELWGFLNRQEFSIALQVLKLELRQNLELPAAAWLGGLAVSSGLEGKIGFKVRQSWPAAEGAPAQWDLEALQFERVFWPAFPLVEAVTGQWSGQGGGREAVLHGALESIHFQGLGIGRGQVTLKTAPDAARLSIDEVSAGEKGRLRGEVKIPLGGAAPLEGEVAGEELDLVLAEDLIRARLERGALQFSGPLAAGQDAGRFSGQLGKAAVRLGRFLKSLPADSPLATLVREELAFDCGQLSGSFGLSGLEARHFQLQSPEVALRFQGAIDWQGKVRKGIAVLAQGEGASRLSQLPADAPIRSWQEAVGEKGWPLHLTGILGQPALQLVSWSDWLPEGKGEGR
ncbi:MAG: hypothetical protein HY717_07110 [Planctomycetes bacterium]|nr:hypothetical protein [Planctomycetota bacterium]